MTTEAILDLDLPIATHRGVRMQLALGKGQPVTIAVRPRLPAHRIVGPQPRPRSCARIGALTLGGGG